MSAERSNIEAEPVSKKTRKSWKSVTKAVRYYEQQKYGKALARLFKYEDVEATAMFCLACMYNRGEGVIKNIETAAAYLLKLVEYKYIRPEEKNLLALARYYLGDLYYRGIVFASDNSKAEWHWKKGALLKKSRYTNRYHDGTVKCWTALGMLYSAPNRKTTKKAIHWHKRAAEAGSIISKGALGVIYMYGIETEVNLQLAYSYLTSAVSFGNIYAKGYLTAYYYKRQMYHRAVSLGRELYELEDYELLAKLNDCNIDHVKQGIAVGCFYLALCLQYGYASEKNLPFAENLIRKALKMSTNVIHDLHVQAILGIA